VKTRTKAWEKTAVVRVHTYHQKNDLWLYFFVKTRTKEEWKNRRGTCPHVTQKMIYGFIVL